MAKDQADLDRVRALDLTEPWEPNVDKGDTGLQTHDPSTEEERPIPRLERASRDEVTKGPADLAKEAGFDGIGLSEPVRRGSAPKERLANSDPIVQ